MLDADKQIWRVCNSIDEGCLDACLHRVSHKEIRVNPYWQPCGVGGPCSISEDKTSVRCKPVEET